jgi:RluA family pseudouridine synthase
MRDKMKNVNIEYNVIYEEFLLNSLFRNINHKSKNNIKNFLARGNVLVDGHIVTRYNYPLKLGQKVKVNMQQVKSKLSRSDIDIIYEDNEIIVVNKPAGLLSIATETEVTSTAYHFVMNYLKNKNENQKVFIVHRLDKDTSGVLMFAKNEKVKFMFQDHWNDIVKNRHYLAIVEGVMEQDKDTIKTWLKENEKHLIYSSHKAGDGDEAITRYEVISRKTNYTLLNVYIDTGRKNQIRVHMNDLKHPIVGDKKYGSKTNPIKRLGLHACELELVHPVTNKFLHFEAPTPDEFNKLFKNI